MQPRALSILALAFLACLALAPAPADEPSADLRARVDNLVEQLRSADAEKRAAAEAELVKLGPTILPLLPAADAKLTSDQSKHVQAVRATLRDAQAKKDLLPRTATLSNPAISLSQALKELARQTGMTVEDRRRDKDQEPTFALDLKQATFWEALDEIALKADLRISLCERDGRLALLDGPHKLLPVSYSGVYRVTLKRLTSVRDLETDTHVWMIDLEIAWEPRFRPLFVETEPDSLVVQDAKGLALKNLPLGSGRAPVMRPLAVGTVVRVEAPEQPTDKIGLLKGTLGVIGPSKMLTFTFSGLTQIERGHKDQARKQTQEGVTATLRELSTERDRWTVGLLLEYPADGPDFESFESWLVNNEIALEKNDGKDRFPENGGFDIEDQAGHRAVLSYRFIEDGKRTLGKAGDWNLVYRTPGTIVKMPVQFEFKDLPRP
jgi:hypothetical protein